MDHISLGTLAIAVILLLVASGFFSIAETAMMAANRHRLKHRAHRGSHGARRALALLGQIDKLLGVILLGNTLVAAGAATLTAVIAKRLYGEGELPLALGTLAITFALLVFSEIAPKIVGAAHADRIAPVVSYLLTPMLQVATPAVWFVNLFVQGLLKLLRVPTGSATGSTLTQEELRSLVLEGKYFRGKHPAMLANLLDVGAVTVDDVMTPRNQIHALDLRAKPGHLAEQLATSYHTRLPAYEDELDNIVGIVHLKQVVGLQQAGTIDESALRSILRPAYFVPAGTPLVAQLQQFQTDHERLGLVVDEYGELEGLITIEDIVEEIIGDFTTQAGRQRRRRRHGRAAHPQPQARHAFPAGGAEDAQRPHCRAAGRDSRRRHAGDGRRPGPRNPADAGPGGQSRAAPAAGRARAGPGFTKPRGTGIISCLTFMRLE